MTARKKGTAPETPKIPQAEPVKPPLAKAEPIKPPIAKAEPVKPPIAKAIPVSAPVKENKEPARSPQPTPPQPEKAKPIVAEKIKAQPLKVAMVNAQDLAQPSQRLSGSVDTAFTKLADGFDFPIGKPDGKAITRRAAFARMDILAKIGTASVAETPICAIRFTASAMAWWFLRAMCIMGWGNVVIVRHVFREGGEHQEHRRTLRPPEYHSGKRGPNVSRAVSSWRRSGRRTAFTMRICISRFARISGLG